MLYTIKVEQKHIDSGVKNNCEKCPVALAVAEATDRSVNVWLDRFTVWRDESLGLGDTLPMLGVVLDWIHRFDRGQPVEPFAFYLDVPE